jgi:O-antigen/teichoic acid export membrane protein
MESSELKHKTFHSVIWAVIRVGTSNVLGFILFLVLARVLSPRDFGVFALATLVVDIARVISTAGLSDAITRDKAADEVLADTAFWASLGLGCAVGAAAWILAPLYASFIEQPEIASVLRWLAALIPISALGSIHTARKLREFGHKAIAARTIGCGALGGAAAVAAAIAGLGVWSLVVQVAIIETVGVIFAWQSYPWLPRLRFDIRRLTTVWTFSGAMMLVQLMFVLQMRIQDVVIGRFISVPAVGTFRIAWRTFDLITQMTINPIVGVSFITLAHVQDDAERFRNAFLRMLGLSAMLTLPAICGFGVLSGDVIVLLFGAKWAPSAEIAQVLALMALPFCMNSSLYSAFAAMGRPGCMTKSTVLQFAAAVILSLLAAPFGVQWVAAAFVLRAFLTLPYHLVLFRRETGIGMLAVMRAVMPPFLASVAMCVALWVAAPFIRNVVGDGIAFLAVAVLLGCGVYISSLLLCAGDYVRSHAGVLLPLWKRQRLDTVPQEIH